jgi:hypothetical protein
VEEEFERMIESHLRDVDKRITRGHQRLKLSKEQGGDGVTGAGFLFGGHNDEKVGQARNRHPLGDHPQQGVERRGPGRYL